MEVPAAGGAVLGAVRRGGGEALRLRLPLKERERLELYLERREAPPCEGGPRRLCGRPSLGVPSGDLPPRPLPTSRQASGNGLMNEKDGLEERWIGKALPRIDFC